LRDPETLSPSDRMKSLAAIMTAIGVAGMGMGLTGPLFSYAFDAGGYSRTLTGLNFAVFALAIVIFAPVVPSLMRRIGTTNVLWIAQFTAVICLLLFRLTDNVVMWFAVRFVMGLAMTALFVATEIWINLIAHENARGRVLGIYTVFLSGGFAAGIAILYVVGSTGWEPVWITAALFALAGLPIFIARHLAPPDPSTEQRGPILPFLKAAPSALLAAMVFGAVEMGILNLLNIYGLRSGLPEQGATLMLLSTSAGNLVGPVIVGILADRMDRRVLLAGCAAVGAASALLIPANIHNLLFLHLFLFINGGIVVGLYTVGLTRIGEKFKGHDLAGANAAFITMYGIGALAGPFLGGVAMDIWDPNGLMVVFFGLCAGYGLMVFARIRKSTSLTGGAA